MPDSLTRLDSDRRQWLSSWHPSCWFHYYPLPGNKIGWEQVKRVHSNIHVMNHSKVVKIMIKCETSSSHKTIYWYMYILTPSQGFLIILCIKLVLGERVIVTIFLGGSF